MILPLLLQALALLVALTRTAAAGARGGGGSEVQDTLNSFRAFDDSLRALVAEAEAEEEEEGDASPALLARIGMKYWERDARWQQGGASEALRYIKAANKQTSQAEEPLEKFSLTLQQGVLESALGKLQEAKQSLEKALSLSRRTSTSATVLFHTGAMLLLLGGQDDRRKAFNLLEESLQLGPCGPEAPNARVLLVQAYALLDDASEEGWGDIIKALEAENCGSRVGGMVANAKASAGVRPDGAVTSLAGSEEGGGQTQRALFFAEDALGKNRTKAWLHLQHANLLDSQRLDKLGKATTSYSLEASTAEAKRAIQMGYLPPARLKVGSSSRMPIFIVGFPRSGSTILETMLDAHPGAFGMGEVSAVPFQLDQMEAELSRRQRAAQAKKVSQNAFETEYRQIVAKHADSLLQFMKARVKESGKGGKGGGGKVTRVIDKTLRNSRNIAHLLLLFPNASVIHITRNPLDTLFSCYKHGFGSAAMRYTLDQVTLVKEYALYLQVMEHFRTTLPSGKLLEVRYEDLVCSPEAIMRHVLAFTGLPWNAAVLRHHETGRQVKTASLLQVKEPLFLRSLGAYLPYSEYLHVLRSSLAQSANVTVEVEARVTCDV